MRGWLPCASAPTKKRAVDTAEAPADAELAEMTVAEVRALLETVLPLPAHSKELRRRWSRYRRRRRQQARESYQDRAQRRAAASAPTMPIRDR